MENNESDIFSYLVTNENFRDWVLSPNDERNYYWKKWMDENPEAIAEVKKAREFIERMHFKKEQLSHDELDGLLEQVIASEKRTHQFSLHAPERINNETFNTTHQWVKVAAILVICFMSAIFIDKYITLHQVEEGPVVAVWKTIKNPKGIKSKITLPDGTLVILNADSELRYPAFFADTQRLITLTGEAFFEVVRDEQRLFIIQSEKMTTEVLGTSFNIKAYADSENQSIAVVSGKVKVRNTLGEAEILRQNEMILIDKDNDLSKTTFDIKQVTGWKDGVISFKSASFQEIQERLSLWYGVDFTTSAGFRMESVYTGEYVNETLENVLDGISYSSGFKYRITDNEVYVYQ